MMSMTQDNIHKKIVVLIPCYNEEKGIGEVIERFPRGQIAYRGYTLEIVVIDNNSIDRTAEIARASGARVISELKKGKGNAMRTGFREVSEDASFVVMLDGDATYRPEEILRLVELLDSKFCTAVVGSRLGGYIAPGSMTALNRAGNWFFAHIVRYIYRVNVTDVLTGYFAWTREALMRLHPHLTSSGFAIEMEMVTKMAKIGEAVYAVPISYEPRAGQTNLRPFYDGFRILMMFMRNLFWQPDKKPPFVSEGGKVQSVTGI
jgi:dolichol-phosphate hexosyltransferase